MFLETCILVITHTSSIHLVLAIQNVCADEKSCNTVYHMYDHHQPDAALQDRGMLGSAWLILQRIEHHLFLGQMSLL